jgi:uncharacterized protein YacL
MNKLVKESEYFLSWLVFWLCSTIVGGIVGAIVGVIAGAILGIMKVDIKTISLICSILGGVFAIPVSYLFFRLFVAKMIVRKISNRIAVSAPAENQQI